MFQTKIEQPAATQDAIIESGRLVLRVEAVF